MRLLIVLLFLGIWLGPATVSAQNRAERPTQGIVWEEPAGFDAAIRDLRRMDAMGIEAVRMAPLRAEALLTLTDTLGIQLYQEIPVAGLPAARLRDTLAFAERSLMQLLGTGAQHRSARTFGLARGSDTSDSTACAYFARLADRARRVSGGAVRVYYVTRFIEADVCGHTVDFVLLDALGNPDPAAMVRRWQDAHPDVPVGVAALGLFVADQSARGVNVVGSPDAQARYLERSLRQLVQRDTGAPPPIAVFVYRWRDVQPDTPSPAFDLENPYRHSFGLHGNDGQARPAADVVAGMYGRNQDAFAYPAGQPRRAGYPITTVAGWGVLLILAIAYASSPRMRPMVPRYFTAHGFYREAVREGRDVLMTASIVMLVALALAVAIIWLVVLNLWRTSEEFLLLFQMLPRGVEEFLVTLLARPFLFLLLVSSLYGVSLTIWGAALAFGSRRRYPLAPAQAMMLAIWPRWAVILLMLVAMVLATLPPGTSFMPAAYLLVAWFGVTLVATARTLYDYASVTRVTAGRLAVGALLNPIVLILLALAVLALRYQPETTFLWHVLTRS